MAKVELIMPKMGESIMEATILKWLKQPGDAVEMDEPILEIATDKVDSEVPSPADGVLEAVFFQADDVVEIGKVIAIITTSTEATVAASPAVQSPPTNGHLPQPETQPIEQPVATVVAEKTTPPPTDDRFYSPLVRSIAAKEAIEPTELATIQGTGEQGRVTKKDILTYVESRSQAPIAPQPTPPKPQPAAPTPPMVSVSGEVEIIEMDRMRKLIAEHMVNSKRTSPHVTSFVEADVTNLVQWRDANKKSFEARYNEKLTFMPIFVEAVVKAIQDFPMINVSVEGTKIIRKKFINVGMATALPTGNLIVPVIKNADHLNLLGIAKQLNDLANRARMNKLKPEEIQDGTFTLTNVGTFGNLSGVPIINQPQVAIMSVGAIRKKPGVVETEYGDFIAVRQMMMISLSYDHRVVDGYLGGSFLRRFADYLEQFDVKRTI